VKFALCNELFGDAPFEETCRVAASMGYAGLEVAPFTLSEEPATIPAERRRALRETAARHGVELLGLHWLLVKPPGMYITSPDAAVRGRTSAFFRALVDLCADLGGNVMIIGSPKQRSLLPGVSLERAIGYAIEVLSPSLPVAAERGVTLAFEPLTPGDTDFVTTVDQAIALIDRVGHPNFRLNVDVRAMSSESKSVPDIIRSARGYIAHVQVNDPNNLGPGMGEVRYEPIVAALREVGYDGWLSVEAFDFSPGPGRIARESIAYLRRVTGQ
jgi:sugar phosphate isomerase/epimerase